MYDLAINEIHSMASLGGESNLFAIRSSHRVKASSKRRNGPSHEVDQRRATIIGFGGCDVLAGYLRLNQRFHALIVQISITLQVGALGDGYVDQGLGEVKFLNGDGGLAELVIKRRCWTDRGVATHGALWLVGECGPTSALMAD